MLSAEVEERKIYAGVAELADAYGSGPYESNLMKVQVLSPAPINLCRSRAMFTWYLLP